MPMMLLSLCVLSLTTLFLLGYLSILQQSRNQFQLSLLEQNQSLLLTKDSEIQRLTNLLASKDPMTFQILSQSSPDSLMPNSDPYISTGSDEAEYEKWMNARGLSTRDDDIEQDLIEMGL